MKSKHLISTTILISLVAIAIYYLLQNIEDFKALTIVSPYLLVALIIIFIFSYFLISIITKALLSSLGVYLKSKESFALSIVTGFYNLITPFRGGMATRAIYLKKKHNFSYTDFLASLSGMYILTFLVASFLGLLSTYLIYLKEGIFSQIIFMIFLGIFLPLLLIIIFSPKLPETKNRFINKFIKVINGWHTIKNNKKVILLVFSITLIQLLIGSLMIYLQFQVFGIEINFIKCIFLSAIGNISLLVAITPANLGIGEAVTVFSALTIGITATESLSATLLGRAISFLVLFILGPIFSYILLKHKPKEQGEKNETRNN